MLVAYIKSLVEQILKSCTVQQDVITREKFPKVIHRNYHCSEVNPAYRTVSVCLGVCVFLCLYVCYVLPSLRFLRSGMTSTEQLVLDLHLSLKIDVKFLSTDTFLLTDTYH